MAASTNNDKLSLGITLLIFGLLFLLDKLGLLVQIPIKYNFISVSCFFLVAGITFILTQPKRGLSWVLLAIGVFLNSDIFFGWMNMYSKFIVPIILVIVGIVMIVTSKK